MQAGELGEARKAADAFEQIVTRSPLPYHQWYAPLLRGAFALIAGDLEAASACAEEIDPAATAQGLMAVVNRETLLGEIEIARGSAAAGVRRLYNMLVDVLGAGSFVEAHLAALERGPAAGRAALAIAIPATLNSPIDEDWFAIMTSHAAAAVLSSDDVQAKVLFERLEPFANRWVVLANGGSCRGPVSSFLSNLAATAGMMDQAEFYREQAEQALADAGAPGLLHWLNLGPLNASFGSAPAPLRTGKLSLREGEVLALLARGHSNQEIADALVLSVRTVQRHVQNVYGRLGVHNRAGAAVAAVELGLVSRGDVRTGETG
jgi:DNA-binding CsgD family transcriptional regulator